MRRFRDICVVLALFGLAGSARAQFYPPPYSPYARPNYYPPPNYYGYSPNPPTPACLPGYYAAPRPPAPAEASPPAPAAFDAQRVIQTQGVAQEQLPLPAIPQPEIVEPGIAQPEIVLSDPESMPPAQRPIATGGQRTGLPAVGFTIPAVFACSPYTSPTPTTFFWAKSEYLVWRMRDGPPHFPLVTTDSNPGPINAGSVISPTTTVLFGNDGFQYGDFHGGRLTLGLWLDQDQRFGIEGSGFLQETRSVSFHAGSDVYPALYIPAYDLLRGTEASVILADPTIPLTGTVDIASTMQLWGAEINGVYRLLRTCGWNVELLAGLRYLELLETIDLQNTTSGFNETVYLMDHFQTRNQFYGPQVGVRSDYTYGRFSVGLSAKIALGVTHEVTEVAGYNTAPLTGSTLGGFFSEPSNIGRTTVNSFSAVPQLAATLGFNLTDRVTIFAGYDYMLWTSVARAGDQIDRVLNLSQSVPFGSGSLTNNLARPEPLLHHADFWAQGISVGMQLRY